MFIAGFSIAGASALRAAMLLVPFFVTLQKTWYPVSRPGLLDWFVALVPMAAGLFIFAAAEEIGWRGFALPRLISSIGVFRAACALGVMWALWHLPLAFTDGNPLRGENFILFLAGIILESLLITYIWVYTGSVLLITLFHATVNLTFFLLEPTATTGYRTTIALVLVVGIAYVLQRSGSDARKVQTGAAVD
jgi:membrane protease YdiL (CAAX protease family)